MADIKWTDIVTALVALYAAGLSTYNFIMERRDKRPSLNVRLSYGALTLSDHGQIVLLFNVSNAGSQPITLTSIGVRLNDKRTLYMPQLSGTASLPIELQPGQGRLFWMLPHVVAQSLHEQGYNGEQKVRAVCTDATGREHFSKSWTFNIEARLNDSSFNSVTD